MKKLVINETNNQNYDSKVEKARAIIQDNNGKIYICEMNGSFLLPGGTVEINETHFDTINRELKEELGVENALLQELIQIDYYHDNFPKYNQEGYEKRLNVVYYYISKTPIEVDIKKSDFSNYEISNNIKINKYSVEEIITKINEYSSNKWKKFTDLEMTTILQTFIGIDFEK